MALSVCHIGLVAIIAATICATSSAQSDCTTALVSLSPCLNYISGNDSTPSSSCCSQLANVVKAEPQCLCTVLNGGASSLGITINKTQALALPGACNVQTQSASRCNGIGGAPSPSGSPSAPNIVPSGGEAKTIPSIDTNSGSSVRIPFCTIFSFLFAAAYVSAPDWLMSFV